jgi:hypothetical protein
MIRRSLAALNVKAALPALLDMNLQRATKIKISGDSALSIRTGLPDHQGAGKIRSDWNRLIL